MYLFKTQLFIDGDEKMTHDYMEHFFNNTLYYDSNKTSDNKMLMWSGNQYNAQTYLWCSVLPANSGNYEFNIRLSNIFSHLNVYRNFIKTENVKIRITFNTFLSDLADESVIKMSNPTLKVDGVRIDDELKKYYLSIRDDKLGLGYLTYGYTYMIKRTPSLSTLTSGQNYEIKIDSFGYKADAVLVFVTPVNDSTSKLNNYVKFYELTNLQLFNKDDTSLTNGIVYNGYSDLIYNCCKYWFKDSWFFLSKSTDWTHKNNMYLINFSSNIANDIHNNTHSGSKNLYEGTKLKFTALESSLQSVNVNVILFWPGFIKITRQNIEKIYSSVKNE